MEFGVVESIGILTIAWIFMVFLKNKKIKDFPPGPPGLPIVGNFLQLTNEPYKHFMELRKKYGDIFSVYLGEYRMIVLNNPKLIKEAFAEPAFSGRVSFLPAVKDRTGGVARGIIFSDGKLWSEQRRFALKTLKDFGFGKKSIENIVTEEIRELIETFQESVGKPIQTQGKFNAAVLNVLWSMITGKRYAHDDPQLQDLMKLLISSTANTTTLPAVNFFPLFAWLRKYFYSLLPSTKLRQEMRNKTIAFIKETIEEHKKTFQPEDPPRDFIDCYLMEMKTAPKDSSFYGKDGEVNLLFTMMDLFIAGAETTSTTLTWEFLLLAQHPQVQQKLHDEIQSVVGTSRLPSLEDRSNLPYTEATMMEVLRYSALVPTAVLHATTEDVEFHKFKIPKQTMVFPNIWGCLRDPQIWDDPDKFRPERFLSEDGKTIVKHEAFIPFSTGKRVCLGEALARDELFLFTTALFQRFEATMKDKDKEVGYIPASILIPKAHDIVLRDRNNVY